MTAMTGQAIACYASAAATLTQYAVDAGAGTLTRRATVRLPAMVQYAWPHANRRVLYVASSDSGPGREARAGREHHLSALSIDPASGALSPLGAPVRLPARPIHVSTDAASRFLLTAYNQPSSVTVHRIEADGSVGASVPQATGLDVGIYAHQVRTLPSGRAAVVVARGNDAEHGAAEDPGALVVLPFADGSLGAPVAVAPNGGYAFGPRHLDFDPGGRFVYVSVERQNQLMVFGLRPDGIDRDPLFVRSTLADRERPRPRQVAGTVRVHPDGRTVYVANRAYGSEDIDGRRVATGGENNLAVFAIDATTGAPTLVQHIDTEGFGCRTFAIDPTGTLLVAGNLMSLAVRDGNGLRDVPVSIALFRIAGDGRLTFLRKVDVETGGAQQFWTGLVALP